MSKKRARGVSAEERALWDKVVQSATPLPKRAVSGPRLSLPGKAAPPKADPVREAPGIAPFRIGQASRGAASTAPVPAPETPLALDRRTQTRLRRGKAVPEARIDLHGMTVADAHPALTAFILRAQAAGKRLVLVITGKGRGGGDGGPVPERRGVLRQQLPRWLAAPPLSGAVIEVTEAHARHGGSGAFYVYLRRRRN